MSAPYPWQADHWQHLITREQQQRLAHAYLLLGQAGLGKVSFATAYLQRRLCHAPTASLYCGRCRSCVLVQAGSHPDFYRVTPEGGASSIKIDQIRTLSHALSLTPALGHGQVVLISPASKMQVAAVNALLKTLEEPRGQVIIILIADALYTIPATIVSRCQRLSFVRPGYDDARLWLTETVGVPSDQAEKYLGLAGGAPRIAQQYFENGYTLADHLHAKRLLNLLTAREDITQTVQSLLVDNVADVLDRLFALVFDLVRVAMGYPSAALHHPDQQAEFLSIARLVSTDKVLDYLECVCEAQRNIQSTSGLNAQLLLERLLIQWSQLKRV